MTWGRGQWEGAMGIQDFPDPPPPRHTHTHTHTHTHPSPLQSILPSQLASKGALALPVTFSCCQGNKHHMIREGGGDGPLRANMDKAPKAALGAITTDYHNHFASRHFWWQVFSSMAETPLLQFLLHLRPFFSLSLFGFWQQIRITLIKLRIEAPTATVVVLRHLKGMNFVDLTLKMTVFLF